MKQFVQAFVTLILSQNVYAMEHCFEFQVGQFSNGLKNIQLSVPIKPGKSGKFPAKILAVKSKAMFTATQFECEKAQTKVICVQPNGGGDFVLQPDDSGPRLVLTYLNLAIGGEGPSRYSGTGDITEDFAIFNTSNSKETEGDDESGELEEFFIPGKVSDCLKKQSFDGL